MLTKIALKRLHIWPMTSTVKVELQSLGVGFELGQLGYKISNIEEFKSTSKEEFASVIATLREMRGASVKYVPLFSNFPDDLPNDSVYLMQRVLGFLGVNTFASANFGANPVTQMQEENLWQQAVEAQAKRLQDSHTEWIILTLLDEAEVNQRLQNWVLDLVYGATPVKENLWDDIFTVAEELKVSFHIDQIKIKETLARVSAHYWLKWEQILVKTPSDLLRMLAFIQGMDVSLAKKVNFNGLKLSKPQRRAIIAFLDSCASLGEDLLRYRRLWISFSNWLHPGDFVKRYPKVAKTFDDLRNNRIKSFESRVINAPSTERLAILAERPSVMLRKLTWLLNELEPEEVTNALLNLQTRIEKGNLNLPLPLLLNAYSAIKYQGDRFSVKPRLVINKKGQPYALEENLDLEPKDTSTVLDALKTLIVDTLGETQQWSTVWIDPALEKLVLPLQVRKQSDGLLNLARGSRLRVDTPVIRLFVYWQENAERTDLDLSILRLNQDFKHAGYVSWSNYGRGGDLVHSGDIQSAPLGAAEFVDIKLDSVKDGYLLPCVLKYSGENFSDLKACYGGWMKREAVAADMETFDAKTVAEKVEVNMDAQLWIPFLYDVEAKEIIYADLYLSGSRTVENNPHFSLLAKALATSWQAKPTFEFLASCFVMANHASIVSRVEAETTIGLDDTCTLNVLKLVGQRVTSF